MDYRLVAQVDLEALLGSTANPQLVFKTTQRTMLALVSNVDNRCSKSSIAYISENVGVQPLLGLK